MQKIREQVLEFMKSINTSEMSSNEFIWKYIEFITGNYKEGLTISRDLFFKMPSVETIVRQRRWISANLLIGIRTKPDTEEEYIDEFFEVTP